jgi:hypothetical protein
MALKITYINEDAPSPKVRIDERLWQTADRERLVPDGHPDAAFLFCAPGQEISKVEFDRFKLDSLAGKVEAVEVTRAEADAEPQAEAEAPEPQEEPTAEKAEKPKRRSRATKG